MKINVEFDITPAELRKILGLPDVGFINENLLLQMQKMLKGGVEGFDPVNLLSPLVSQSIDNFSAMQNLMLQAASGFSGSSQKDKKQEDEQQEEQDSEESKEEAQILDKENDATNTKNSNKKDETDKKNKK